MKDRTREALFNILGTAVSEKMAIDMFAGTGVLGIEALSRGAASAVFVERRFAAARQIQRSVEQLGLSDRAVIVPGDAFHWIRGVAFDEATPWIVFICPPYEFFHRRWEAMSGLLQTAVQRAPAGSLFVVESDDQWDTDSLPTGLAWEVRRYPPALIAIAQT